VLLKNDLKITLRNKNRKEEQYANLMQNSNQPVILSLSKKVVKTTYETVEYKNISARHG